MPAYTGGFLAPVPFLYAAVKLRLAKLWLIAAAYVAVWVIARVLTAFRPDYHVLSAVGGSLTLLLAMGGTVHAFVLRESLSRRPREQVDIVGPQRPETFVTAPVSDPTQTMCAQVRVALASLTSSVRQHAELFPAECKQLLDESIGQMEQVASFVASGGHADAELRSVHAIATDYLLTSINTYVRLPREYALTHRNSGGRTPAQELELELRLLRDKTKEAADSLHHIDALRLQEQSAFLQAKFGRSELDIP
jgi:uncharacterized membrane protein (DUF485 family)